MKKSGKTKKVITDLSVAAFRKIKQNPAILLWSIADFFFLTFLVFIPHIASFLALITAVLIAPVKKWQSFLNQKVKKVGKTIIIVALVFVTLFAVPSDPTIDQVTLQDDSTTKSTEASAEILTQPTETEMPTPVVTEPPVTEVPTQKPTEPPVTEAPTQKPTEPPVTEAPTQKPTEPPVTEAPTQKPTEPPVTEEPTQKPTEPPVTEAPTEPTTKVESEGNYVLNTDTKKFHFPGCAWGKKIDAENREEFCGTREELIEDGYSPCGHCDP